MSNLFALFVVFAACVFVFLALHTSASTQTWDPCPRGSYMPPKATFRECALCPRGVYGSTSNLTSSACTAPCPAGRYNDMLGAKTPDDCKLCPRGKYGALTGMKTQQCSGNCPAGKFGTSSGLTDAVSCTLCPAPSVKKGMGTSQWDWECYKYAGSTHDPLIGRATNTYRGGK